MKVITVVGARPQFVKAAVLSRAIEEHNRNNGSPINEVMVHTGQHYDHGMSHIFFDELKIPEPAYNLGIGSGTHGETTGKMLIALEKELKKTKPDTGGFSGDRIFRGQDIETKLALLFKPMEPASTSTTLFIG